MRVLSRRGAISRGVSIAVAGSLSRTLSLPALGALVEEGEFLAAALLAERWIASSAIRGPEGVSWPADPWEPGSTQNNLYSGGPGVILFYLELFHATADRRFLAVAEAGARQLSATIRGADAAATWAGERAGLYTGLAGVVYVLERVHAATGRDDHGQAARRGFRLLLELARRDRETASWSGSNDVISGTAGIGLVLLWGARAFDDGRAVDLAAAAGRQLVTAGIPRGDGLTWEISPRVPRRYPNFSHGAAGVSYFLTRLSEATGDRWFLATALKGATYLQAISTETPGEGRIVFHSEPGNEQIYYVSWCHGPPGTARLFQALARATGLKEYQDWVTRLDNALTATGAPEKRSSGYWNNISRCCGNAGIADHNLAMHRRSGVSRYLQAAARVMRDTLSRGTSDGDGIRWIQAEHRVRPELLVAQTGLMQGAAGVGITLLHLDGGFAGRNRAIVLPDEDP